METYILTQFIEEFESEAAKPDMNSDIGKVCKSLKITIFPQSILTLQAQWNYNVLPYLQNQHCDEYYTVSRLSQKKSNLWISSNNK